MYTIAIIGDLLGIIPGFNIVTDGITAFLLYHIGRREGIDIYSSENIVGTLGVIFLEAVPGLSSLPSWTLRVYLAKKRQQPIPVPHQEI